MEIFERRVNRDIRRGAVAITFNLLNATCYAYAHVAYVTSATSPGKRLVP